VCLPEVRPLGPRGLRRVPVTAQSQPRAPLEGSAGQYEPLRLMVVAGASADSRLWMELIQRYHYLGYRVARGSAVALSGALGPHWWSDPGPASNERVPLGRRPPATSGSAGAMTSGGGAWPTSSTTVGS